MEFVFKNLIVWQKAMELAKLAYGLVRQFPAEEKYALADQLRRAAASIPSNIAEGNGSTSPKELVHFLSIARGSVYEVVTQLIVAKRQGLIPDITIAESHANEISRILSAMISRSSKF